MNQEKRPITLEDILRLKRAERPPAAFWDQFDRDLRARQLTALLEKRPWWRSAAVSQAWSLWSRYHLPLGATAIFALTFVAMREYRPTPEAVAPHSRASRVAIAAPHANSSAAGLPALESSSAISDEQPTEIAGEAMVAEAVSAPAAATLAPGELSHLLTGDARVTPSDVTPSARHIAANLAAAEAAGPLVARRLLTPATGFEMRVLPARATTTEPLASMSSPAAMRNSRLLSAMAFATEAPARSNENVARRLSDEQLYDSGAHRFGAKANSLTFKM
ncbi:MAG TPA: hypothetical protein VHD62_06035 [Opitutaceae bacterium]|nr:hypothetical protein [Opitutaceae bacterium]